MAFIFTDIISYLKSNKLIMIATVDRQNTPEIRTIGDYSFDGFKLYFAADKSAGKVEQIGHDEEVAVLVQHENQESPDFVNITLYGKTKRLTGSDYDTAKNKLLDRRPRAVYQEDSINIYQVIPKMIKIFDLSKKQGDQIKLIVP